MLLESSVLDASQASAATEQSFPYAAKRPRLGACNGDLAATKHLQACTLGAEDSLPSQDAPCSLDPSGADGAASEEAGGTGTGALWCSTRSGADAGVVQEGELEDVSSASQLADEFAVYSSPATQGVLPPSTAAARSSVADAGSTTVPWPLAPQQAVPLQLPAEQRRAPSLDPELAEMLSVMLDCEAELQMSPSYLEAHDQRAAPGGAHLDAGMRKTAISWLVEVALEYGLHQETLYLAANLLDRFLSATKCVPRTQLQLVSVACMLVAAKHEEEEHPSIADFTSIADNCFTNSDLLRMEATVLAALGYRINAPTPHTFLSLYKQALALEPRTCALACYLTELAMLEYGMLAYRPSQVAAAAALLAQLYFNDVHSLRELPAVTSYSTDDLKHCTRHLLALQREAWAARDWSSPYLAVRDKFRAHAWLCASAVTPFDKLPCQFLPSLPPLPPPPRGASPGAPASAARQQLDCPPAATALPHAMGSRPCYSP